MSITPEQARALLDGATPGPWEALFDNEAIETDTSTVLCNTDGAVEWGRNIEHDVPLAAAAPDLAQTISGMRWEYAVEMMGDDWEMVGLYGPDEPWGSEADARGAMKAWRSPRPIRLVRRLVGPVEVVE